MVRTSRQLENLSKDELIDEVLSLENFKNDINVRFSELNDRFNDIEAKYEMVNSNLSIARRCNDLLLERITQLERNNLINAQYTRRETLEIKPVPSDIADDVLEQSMCQTLSLTGISVETDNLQACHRMRKKDRVIIKFKCRKQKHRVLLSCETLQNRSLDLTQLKFSGKLFVNERMCHENHQLVYKCRQWKSARKIYSTWFYNSTLHMKLLENGPIHKIFHPTDIEKVLGVDNCDEYVNNVSF